MENLELPAGTLFANRFELDRVAGSGGMGTVYRARDRYTGDFVALKLLHKSASSAEEGDRFGREAQLLAQLRHPGIVCYVAHGQAGDGQRYLAMHWLAGEDLGQHLRRSGPLQLRDCMLLLTRIASALAVAHQQGIIHRDLKPGNIMLRDGDLGQPVLLDFGIARRQVGSQAMTRTGLVVGTPAYMAPEQTRGVRELTAAADVFSLGCVLYECLAGEPPFVGPHLAAVLVRILFEDPVPVEQRRLGVPPQVTELVRRMLAKTPTERIADAGALLTALSALGEVAELPASSIVHVAPSATSGFAESEQGLFSLVVASGVAPAAPPGVSFGRPDAELDTLPNLPAVSQDERRRSLLTALHKLGVSADCLVDGSLVATVPPAGSATDQVTLAARVGLLIKDRWPAAVVALATGRGVAQGTTMVGEVADRAGHLMEHRTGEPPETLGEYGKGVWIDTLSARLLGPHFAVVHTAAGPLLIGEEKETDASRPLLGKPTPCLGRDVELAMLEGLLSGCIENVEARAAIITALPGVGKSRLRHEFLRRVDKREEPVTVLFGRGDQMSAGTPYGILGETIHRLCGLRGSESITDQHYRLRERLGRHVAPAERERVALFLGELSRIPFPPEDSPLLHAAHKDPKLMLDGMRHAFFDWLAAECQAAPVLLVLDDLHWGDALSVALLDEALRELKAAPLCVLALGRPELHQTFPKLWHSHRPQEIPLKGLSKKACERLIQQVLGVDVPPAVIARAVEHAAGNALFLEELIRSIAEGGTKDSLGGDWEVPETVVAMLQARIGRFDSGPRRVVRAASVFGRTFWSSGVAALLGLPGGDPEFEEWLAKLIDTEMIEPHADSRLAEQKEYGFRHALIQEAAYTLLTDNNILTGHRLAAEFLESAGERDPATIAEHYVLGSEFARAVPLFERAGDDAARRCLNPAARRHYAATVAALGKLPPSPQTRRQQAESLLKQTRVSLVAETSEQNLQRLTAAEALLNENLQTAEISAPADTLAAPASPGAPAPLGAPAPREPVTPEDELLRARVQYFIGRVHHYAGRYPDAIRCYQRVLPVAQRFADPELIAMPAGMLGFTLVCQGHFVKGEALLQQAVAYLDPALEPYDFIRTCGIYGAALSGLGQVAAGRRIMDRGLAHAQEINQPSAVSVIHGLISCAEVLIGDWPAAIESGERLAELSSHTGDKVHEFLGHGLLGWAHSFLGHHELARSLRHRGRELAKTMGGRLMLSDWFDAADAEIALNAAYYEEALQRAQAVAAASRAAGLVMSLGMAERVWGSALAELGGPAQEWAPHFATSIELFEAERLLPQLGLTRLRWAHALRTGGEAAAADAQFSQAIVALQTGGCDYALTQAHRLAAQPPPPAEPLAAQV